MAMDTRRVWFGMADVPELAVRSPGGYRKVFLRLAKQGTTPCRSVQVLKTLSMPLTCSVPERCTSQAQVANGVVPTIRTSSEAATDLRCPGRKPQLTALGRLLPPHGA